MSAEHILATHRLPVDPRHFHWHRLPSSQEALEGLCHLADAHTVWSVRFEVLWCRSRERRIVPGRCGLVCSPSREEQHLDRCCCLTNRLLLLLPVEKISI